MSESSPFHLLDTIALIRDVPEIGLSAGEIGTIVEILSTDAFEVEFVDEAGQTYGLHTLNAGQVVVLHTKGHPLRTSLRAA